MKLEDVLRAVKVRQIQGARDAVVQGIAYDSRQVRPGYLFVALPGLNVDGARFIDDAAGRGAVAVVAETTPMGQVGQRKLAHIQVDDARCALAEVSRTFYHDPAKHMEVVGITGTNGKTTTAYMIKALLAAADRRPGLIGTVAYEAGHRIVPATRTTPESLDLHRMMGEMVNAGCRSAVMEVSSHALDQKRVWGIDFNVGVFTNLTQDHLDYHGCMDRYFEAKALLFDRLGRGRKKAWSVIDIDDPWGRRLVDRPDRASEDLTYGLHPSAMVRAENVKVSDRGARFTCLTPWGQAEIRLRLLGRFNVSNALAAIASGGALGLDLALIADVMSRFDTVPGRLERITNPLGLRVYVDYAHTPDALESVLKTLREVARGQLIVVFGCGGNRDQDKRAIMGSIASRLADASILTSDNPRREEPMAIIRQIEGGMAEGAVYEIEESREKAIVRALELAQAGDMILIAGKGHENCQEFAHTIIPFDDREVARRALKAAARERKRAGEEG